MADFGIDDAAWSIEHNALVRVTEVERERRGRVPARYTIMLRGGLTFANFPGYSLRVPTQSEIEAVFGKAQANG